MGQRLLLMLLWQGAAFSITAAQSAAAALDVEACPARGGTAAGTVLMQKAVMPHRSVPPGEESDMESAQAAPMPMAASHPAVAPTAVVQAAIQVKPKVEAAAAKKALSATEVAIPEKPKVAAAAAKKAALPEMEKMKAAPAPSKRSAALGAVPAPMHRSALAEAMAMPSDRFGLIEEADNDPRRHRIISAGQIGAAGGASEVGMADQVAVGALDFVATGARTEYCKSWLRGNAFMCEFGAIFLGLLVCTPLVALSVAAFWGIVSGLKSVH